MSIDYALGVIAGEGCFTVGHKTKNGHIYINPQFTVKMKNKDVETLKSLKNSFDNIGAIKTHGDMSKWDVYGKDNFKHLVNKINKQAPEMWWKSDKAKNFKIWEKIIKIYVNGYNDSDDTAKMFRIAEELNKNSGKSVDFSNKAEIAEADSYGNTCGYIKSDGEPCQRRVPSADETCWDH